MAKFIKKFSVTLTDLNQIFELSIPVNAENVALRVLCRYEPEQTPPPPEIVVITFALEPDPTPLTAKVRNFMLVPNYEQLPATVLKYIGDVPFGPDKQLVHIIEV